MKRLIVKTAHFPPLKAPEEHLKARTFFLSILLSSLFSCHRFRWEPFLKMFLCISALELVHNSREWIFCILCWIHNRQKRVSRTQDWIRQISVTSFAKSQFFEPNCAITQYNRVYRKGKFQLWCTTCVPFSIA